MLCADVSLDRQCPEWYICHPYFTPFIPPPAVEKWSYQGYYAQPLSKTTFLVVGALFTLHAESNSEPKTREGYFIHTDHDNTGHPDPQ